MSVNLFVKRRFTVERQALRGSCFTRVILSDSERKFILNSFSPAGIGLNSKFSSLQLQPWWRALLIGSPEEKCSQVS